MSYKIIAIPVFEKELKDLNKKYASIKSDYQELLEILETNPIQGKPLGKDCYKIRLAIKSKGKGKSGGARLVTCVKVVDNIVYLVSIFDKSEKENISDSDLKSRLKFIY